MIYNDLLEPLVTSLRVVKQAIDDHRSLIGKNEIRTRNVLVDPVLRSLGWDVGNLADVEVEFGPSKKRVDYALLGDARKPLVLVEAKKLDESLDSHRTQILTYCTEIGIPYAVLTDGNCWDIYHAWQGKPLDERRIVQVIISSRPPPTAARMLLRLWKENVRANGLLLDDSGS